MDGPTTMPRNVDYYFSLSSPWAYIGNAPFHEVARKHGINITYKPVALGELFPETGGLPLPKRHPSRQKHRMYELQRWRERRGLSFKLKPKHWPVDAKLADCVVLAIVETGGAPNDYLKRAFPAIWEQELNLADPAVIADLLMQAGLKADALLARAASPEIVARYAQNRQDAMDAGAFGSPSFVLDGEVFWGQDRIEFLDDALTSGRAPFRADV
jgi:2-hydroxychromene-2-carboxylate isomerase